MPVMTECLQYSPAFKNQEPELPLSEVEQEKKPEPEEEEPESEMAERVEGDRSISSYGKAFERIGNRELARKFTESAQERLESLKRVKEVGLPSYNEVLTTVEKFLERPKFHIQQLHNRGTLFYPKIFKTDGQRKYILGAKEEEIIPFVESQLASGDFSKSDIFVLSEYFRNVYGGAIIANRDGSLNLEICAGNNSELVHNKVQPLLSISQDFVTGRYLYAEQQKKLSEKEFTALRTTLFRVLNTIPQIPPDERSNYFRFGYSESRLPGYYEFLLGNPDDDPEITDEDLNSLIIIFNDYQNKNKYEAANPLYYNSLNAEN